MTSRLPLTIILLTYNEEENIGPCLDSIAGINAQRFVVDSFSTDGTREIVEDYEIPFVQHPFRNYSAQRNWAQDNDPFDSEWILHMDAGERATPELVRWLNEVFDPNSTDYDGYLIARRAIFLNKWIRYGGYHPIYQLRLARRGTARCEDKAYDQHFICTGAVAPTPRNADLEDIVTNSIREFTVKHARWAVYEAAETVHRQSIREDGGLKPKLFGNPIERRRWFKRNVFQNTPLFARSLLYFGYRYFLKLGFLDGKEGLVFHVLQGFWFRFLVDSMVLEIREGMKHHPLEQVLDEKYNVKLASVLGEAAEVE